jgi:hypothetical protein
MTDQAYLISCAICEKKPNARIKPPLDDTIQAGRSHISLMNDKLRAVGLNELLGGDDWQTNSRLD